MRSPSWAPLRPAADPYMPCGAVSSVSGSHWRSLMATLPRPRQGRLPVHSPRTDLLHGPPDPAVPMPLDDLRVEPRARQVVIEPASRPHSVLAPVACPVPWPVALDPLPAELDARRRSMLDKSLARTPPCDQGRAGWRSRAEGSSGTIKTRITGPLRPGGRPLGLEGPCTASRAEPSAAGTHASDTPPTAAGIVAP